MKSRAQLCSAWISSPKNARAAGQFWGNPAFLIGSGLLGGNSAWISWFPHCQLGMGDFGVTTAVFGGCSQHLCEGSGKRENHGMVWVGMTSKGHPVPALPWAGTPSPVPGRPKPRPTWPWTLQGWGSQLGNLFLSSRASPSSHRGISSQHPTQTCPLSV